MIYLSSVETVLGAPAYSHMCHVWLHDRALSLRGHCIPRREATASDKDVDHRTGNHAGNHICKGIVWITLAFIYCTALAIIIL